MNPQKLFRIFTVVASVGFAAVLLLSIWSVSQKMQTFSIESIERDSIGLGYALFRVGEKFMVDSQTGQLHKRIPEQGFDTFDSDVRAVLTPMNIVKIKIFNTDGLIIYSTEKAIIGERDVGNDKLDDALSGGVNSELEAKEKVADLKFEKRFNVDVVETYLPMYNNDGKIIGAYETYRDVTPVRESISQTIILHALTISGLMLLLLGTLFYLMRYSTRQLASAQNDLQVQADMDALTGLYNHGYMKRQLKMLLAEVRKASLNAETKVASILLLDLDFFKQVNDQYGHMVGDQVLSAVSARIRAAVRETDIVGRYGGEEFIVVMPDTGDDDGYALATRLWERIRNNPILIDKNAHNITASLGITTLKSSDESIDAALHRADKALYNVKQNGRDNVAKS